jgi:hypothetical protein
MHLPYLPAGLGQLGMYACTGWGWVGLLLEGQVISNVPFIHGSSKFHSRFRLN